MMSVIHLNGPINSGKSTIGRALADLLPAASFIDGDDHDALDEAALSVRIQAALDRITARIAAATGSYLIVAYPLEQAQYERVRSAAMSRGARLLVITLAPPLEVALGDRGSRRLSRDERARVVTMYEEGYHARPFSSVVLDTTGRTPEESARQLAGMIRALQDGTDGDSGLDTQRP